MVVFPNSRKNQKPSLNLDSFLQEVILAVNAIYGRVDLQASNYGNAFIGITTTDISYNTLDWASFTLPNQNYAPSLIKRRHDFACTSLNIVTSYCGLQWSAIIKDGA